MSNSSNMGNIGNMSNDVIFLNKVKRGNVSNESNK